MWTAKPAGWALRRLTIAIVIVSILIGLTDTKSCSAAPQKPLWVTAYYPGWEVEKLKPQDIDMRGITDLVYFALEPTADGHVGKPDWPMTDEDAAAVAKAAHNAHAHVLICIGGEDTEKLFKPAIAAANRDTFVKSIVDWVSTHGYDGVDIDMEMVEAHDVPDFQAFIHALRAGLSAQNPRYLLTTAVAGEPSDYIPLQSDFDRMNLMTYAMSGTWQGWQTWYDGPLYNGGRLFPGTTEPFPCADLEVKHMTGAGIAPAKLGVGLAFDGFVWKGATGPNQPIDGVTVSEITYDEMMQKYYAADRVQWDSGAANPYLSIPAAKPADGKFISFMDERACRERVQYARKQGLGGIIVWELGDGYRPTQPPGKRDQLMRAVANAADGS